MSSRTPRKVTVSIDVASFEREASLSSWRLRAAALRGNEDNRVDRDTVAGLRQRMIAVFQPHVVPIFFVAVRAFEQVGTRLLARLQSLSSEATPCVQ